VNTVILLVALSFWQIFFQRVLGIDLSKIPTWKRIAMAVSYMVAGGLIFRFG